MARLGERTRPPARHRPIYAPDALWEAIDARAIEEGTSRSELAVRAFTLLLNIPPELYPSPTPRNTL